MLTRIRKWLNSTAIPDPIERRLAVLLQILLILIILVAASAVFAALLISGFTPRGFQIAAINGFSLLLFSGLLILLRRGYFKAAVGILIGFLLVLAASSISADGITGSPAPTLVFTIALVTAGLLMPRSVLVTVGILSFLVLLAVGLLEISGQIKSGLISPDQHIESTLFLYGAGVVLLTIILDQFGGAFRRSLGDTLATTAALAAESERLQVTLASIGDAVISTDAQGRITFMNAVAEALTGWSTADAAGQPLEQVFNIVNEDTRAIVESPVHKVLREGVIVGLANHTVLIARDGSETPIDDSGAPIRDAAGKIIGVVLVFRDISGRKEHENYSERLQDVTSSLSEAITPQDVARVIEEVSTRLLGSIQTALMQTSRDGKMLEYLNPQAITVPALTQYPTVPTDYASPVSDAARTMQPIWIESRAEWVQQYPHLEQISYDIGFESTFAIPLISRKQVIGAISVTFRDPHVFSSEERAFLTALTRETALALERANLYLTERSARQSAEEANKLKLKFLAMISHELRTPLTSIKGFISTLLAEDVTFSEAEQREFMQIINQESDNLANLVEQLLDLSRLEAGTLSIHATPQPLKAAVEIAQPRLDSLCQTHDLLLDIPADLPLAVFDVIRIAQVFTNLVHNACKYSPQGSQVHISARTEGDFIRVNIRDQGIGIPPGEREHIFEAFRQAANRPVTETKGAGLGLAIARALIETHRGRIWVDDTSESGATLCFTLPIAKHGTAG